MLRNQNVQVTDQEVDLCEAAGAADAEVAEALQGVGEASVIEEVEAVDVERREEAVSVPVEEEGEAEIPILRSLEVSEVVDHKNRMSGVMA